MLTRRVRRAGRSGQRGQTLILALAFIAVFGTVTVAVLRGAEVTGLQQQITQSVASTDAGEEGGAAYAAADSGRTDISLTCAPGNTGKLVMETTGDQANYRVRSGGCPPGGSGGGIGNGPGLNCVLCILNLHPSPTVASSVVMSLHCAQCTGSDLTTTGGDIYANGSVTDDRGITANPGTAGPAHIRFLTGSTFAGCCTPTPTTYAPAIGDPLANDGAPFPAVTGQPAGCTALPGGTWNALNGCSANITSAKTISPGLWSSITLSGSGQITMNPGVYVFTGGISATGNKGDITGTGGVTIFLTCPGYGNGGQPCASNGGAGTAGASISEGGNGAGITLTAPTTGQYGNDQLAILADPNLVGTVLSTAGKGAATITGSVDVRGGDMSMQGNGGNSISGRLIANTLSMSVTGKVGTGLSLGGNFPGVSTSTCGVFDTDVFGAGASPPTGRAVVQSQCGSNALSGLVDLNYVP